MRSNLIPAVVASCLVLGALCPVAASQGVTIILNGRVLPTTVKPVELGGRVMVGMRDIFEALSATIEWDEATQTVTAVQGTTVVVLTIGENTAFINDEAVVLDAPPILLGGSTMVPLRFVAEATGADVEWDGVTRSVLITTGGGVPTVVEGGGLPAPTVTSPGSGDTVGPNVVVHGQSVPGALIRIVTYVYRRDTGELIRTVPGIRHDVWADGGFEFRIATPEVRNLDLEDLYYDIHVTGIKGGAESEATVIRVYRQD